METADVLSERQQSIHEMQWLMQVLELEHGTSRCFVVTVEKLKDYMLIDQPGNRDGSVMQHGYKVATLEAAWQIVVSEARRLAVDD